LDGHPCRLGISNHIYPPPHTPRSIWLMMRRIDDEDLRHASSNYSKSRAVRLAFNTWRNGTLAKISLSGYIFMSVQEMPSANEKWACVFFSNGFLSDRFAFLKFFCILVDPWTFMRRYFVKEDLNTSGPCCRTACVALSIWRLLYRSWRMNWMHLQTSHPPDPRVMDGGSSFASIITHEVDAIA